MKFLAQFIIPVAAFLSIGIYTNLSAQSASSGPKLKALIIDGENNHGVWPKTTMMMKDFLEETGLFEVDIDRTLYTWQGPHYDHSIGLEDIKELLVMYPLENGQKTISVDEPKPDPDYSPDFDAYDVIITNMGWKASTWPEQTKNNFEKYMKNGVDWLSYMLLIIHGEIGLNTTK